jgi:hypothetical protein
MNKKNTIVKTVTKPKEKVIGKVVISGKRMEEIVKKREGQPAILQVKLLTFTVGATIPTMTYGNILPSITVEARTIEEAKRAVMPVIEELYSTYAASVDGKLPKFINKANVTVEEKKVDIKPTPAPVLPPTEKVEVSVQGVKPETPAYVKAYFAINGAMSLEALNLIEDQIQKSVKLAPEDKPRLLTEVLKKRKEFI